MSTDSKELRQFGLVAGSFLSLLFGVLLPWLKGHTLPIWPWVFGGGVLVAVGLVHPTSLRHVCAVWTAAGFALGWIYSRIILSVVFYVVITPMAVVLRLFGRDPMARSFDPGAETYRVPSRRAPIRGMERPF